MRRAPIAAVALLVALAGCTKPYEPQDAGGNGTGSGDAATCTPGVDGCPCPEDTRLMEGACTPIESLVLDVQMAGSGAYAVGVPFLHGPWCLTATDWQDGMRETASLDAFGNRSLDRGQVLWLEGRDASRFYAGVEGVNRTECQTLRDDPWSIDPDPAAGTIEVHSEAAVDFTVYVRTTLRGCTDLRQYQGQVSSGWGQLTERFNGTSCQ